MKKLTVALTVMIGVFVSSASSFLNAASKNAEAAAGPLIFGRRPTAKTAQLMGVNATNPRRKRSGKGSLSQPSGPTGSKRRSAKLRGASNAGARTRLHTAAYEATSTRKTAKRRSETSGDTASPYVNSAWLDAFGYQFDDVNRFHPNLYRSTRT